MELEEILELRSHSEEDDLRPFDQTAANILTLNALIRFSLIPEELSGLHFSLCAGKIDGFRKHWFKKHPVTGKSGLELKKQILTMIAKANHVKTPTEERNLLMEVAQFIELESDDLIPEYLKTYTSNLQGHIRFFIQRDPTRLKKALEQKDLTPQAKALLLDQSLPPEKDGRYLYDNPPLKKPWATVKEIVQHIMFQIPSVCIEEYLPYYLLVAILLPRPDMVKRLEAQGVTLDDLPPYMRGKYDRFKNGYVRVAWCTEEEAEAELLAMQNEPLHNERRGCTIL